MPVSYSVLGQVAPAATTATTLYTVPSSPSTNTIVSTLSVANRSSSPTTYRIAVRKNGAALADQHYIAYDTQIAGNTTAVLTLGLSLASTDVITVYAGAATLTFNAFGSELS